MYTLFSLFVFFPQRSEFEDEIPPPVPLHTEASTHILETPPPTSSDSEHVVTDSGIYYTPTPRESSVPFP